MAGKLAEESAATQRGVDLGWNDDEVALTLRSRSVGFHPARFYDALAANNSDLRDEAVKTVLAQAELVCADWAELLGA